MQSALKSTHSTLDLSLDSFIGCYDELHPLFVEHWHEVAMYQDHIELDVDKERYQQLEELGLIQTVIARDAGRIVGYSVEIVAPHLHYKGDKYAINDIIYLDPEYRHGGYADQMLGFVESELRKDGVSVHILHMKVNIPFEGLALRNGYGKAEYTYSKLIKGDS